MKSTRFILFTTTLFSYGICSFAQPATNDSRLVLEEIVVTAQKRTENIRDVPISVTALSEDFLDDAGISDVTEMSRVVPNMVINASPYLGYVSMRGLGSGNNAGFERSVALVIDGIYYGRQDYLYEALADVERIEVLRGPQGTLFGKNAIAGALNVTTALATPEFTGKLAMMGGDLGRERLRVAVGGALIEDVLNVRASWDDDVQDGYVRNTTAFQPPGENPDPVNTEGLLRSRETSLGRIRFHLPALIDGLDVNATFTQARVAQNSSGIELSTATEASLEVARRYDPATEAIPNRQTSVNYPEETLRTSDSISLQLDYELGEHVVTGVFGTSDYSKVSGLDADFGPFEAIYQNQDDEYEQRSLELRVASPAGTIEYVAGLYYFESELLNLNQTVLLADRTVEIIAAQRNINSPVPPSAEAILNLVTPAQNVLEGNRFFDQSSQSTAAFGQATWNITDALALILGARYSEETKDVDAKLSFNGQVSERFYNTFLDQVPFDEVREREETDFSPKFSVRYDISDAVTAYGTWATAFKGGGFNAAASDKSNLEFEPEEAETLEAGIKSRFLGGAATLNIGLFYTEFENLQVSIFNGTNFSVGNAATATSQGVEIEGQWLAAQWLSLTGSVGYLHSRYDEFSGAPCPATDEADACDISGRELSRAPEWEATFNPRIDITKLIPWLGSNFPATIGFGVDLTYRAHQYFNTDLDPLDEMGGHTEINGNLRIAGLNDDWSVVISGRNLGDKLIKTHGGDVPLQAGTHFGTYEASRRYFAEFQYRW